MSCWKTTPRNWKKWSLSATACNAKVNLSGSVDQINAKQLEARPITNISKGLQGMVPNLNIDFTSGEPGQAAKINIRGEASINGGSPLILIDGVASDAEELNRLLPEDIETLSVLKDASSAAIYGGACRLRCHPDNHETG